MTMAKKVGGPFRLEAFFGKKVFFEDWAVRRESTSKDVGARFRRLPSERKVSRGRGTEE